MLQINGKLFNEALNYKGGDYIGNCYYSKNFLSFSMGAIYS